MLILSITVLSVLIISGMCSLFEAVLYAAPTGHVESLAESGKKSGIVFRDLRTQVDRPITAILSLNTIANTAGASIAGALAAQMFDDVELLAFSGVFTLFILLFSEVIPKTVGVVFAKPLVTAVALPIRGLVFLLAPFVSIVSLLTKTIAGAATNHSLSDEEIVSMARLGQQQGVLEQSEVDVIQNLLALEEKTIANIMTPRTVVYMLPAEHTVADAIKENDLLAHSRIPIFGDRRDDVVGIVLRRDILSSAIDDKADLQLLNLAKTPCFLRDSTTLNKVLAMSLDNNTHLFIAIDQFGGFAGVVTLEDVLEEILGREIVDESDEVADLRQLAEERRKQMLASMNEQ